MLPKRAEKNYLSILIEKKVNNEIYEYTSRTDDLLHHI